MACKLAPGASPEDLSLRVVAMTGDDIGRHLQKVLESEGFESDAYYLRRDASRLGPRRLCTQELIDESDTLRNHCKFAIDSYNTEHGTELELVNVVQANTRTVYAVEGISEEYYITFTTLDVESGQESLYQAKVLEPLSYRGVLKVFICGPKPSSS